MRLQRKRIAILAENLYQEMELWDDMVHAGARFVDQEVVVDGNLITSRKPDDLPAFCRELVKALEKMS